MADYQKLSLQTFLQLLTTKNLPISRAMTVASKIYKDYNTPARLGELTDSKLLSLGVSDKEDRRLVLSALNAAGYRAIAVTTAKHQDAKKRRIADKDDNDDEDENSTSLSREPSTPKTRRQIKCSPPSSPSLPSSSTASSPRKKRKHDDTGTPSSSSSSSSRLLQNEFLPGPGQAADEEGAASLDDLNFHEILDEDVLRHKFTVVNRAPVMMAWACVVAERLGFSRDEALSIASVYTEMNAVSKGVSLGIYDKKRETDLKAAHTEVEAQPYVDLLGRRIPLFRIASGSWRAFTTEDSNGCSTPGGGAAPPRAAYSYITRALRQTAPAVLGAMRLLAESYDPVELNRAGFALYADFRPDVNGWGKRGELKCEILLGLRKKGSRAAPQLSGLNSRVVMTGNGGQALVKHETQSVEEPAHSESDDALRGARVGQESEVEPRTLLDTSFEEFTAEELSVLP